MQNQDTTAVFGNESHDTNVCWRRPADELASLYERLSARQISLYLFITYAWHVSVDRLIQSEIDAIIGSIRGRIIDWIIGWIIGPIFDRIIDRIIKWIIRKCDRGLTFGFSPEPLANNYPF